MLVRKDRLSGFGGGTTSTDVLASRGIKTLVFASTNTDQCVRGSLEDAFARDYDRLLLSNACATTSPDFARKCIEFNPAERWGFSLCEEFV